MVPSVACSVKSYLLFMELLHHASGNAVAMSIYNGGAQKRERNVAAQKRSMGRICICMSPLAEINIIIVALEISIIMKAARSANARMEALAACINEIY